MASLIVRSGVWRKRRMIDFNLLTEKEIEDLSFEEALDRLEVIVDRMEAGEIPLEIAIDMFQEGMRLANRCNIKLENIETRIDTLLEKDGEFIKKPFILEEDKGQ